MKQCMSYYFGKKVLITGNTGFKGSWLSEILLLSGARVYGYALKPPTEPSMFRLLSLDRKIQTCYCDIRDHSSLRQYFDEIHPEVVFHLAAQPVVRESYKSPRETYETNIMGTVNLLECVRHCASVESLVNITTDKVYRNEEWDRAYREDDILDGFDPYSNSKSCSELVTMAYKRSFFADKTPRISTARAGNVIGGGDFAADRIIPDCIRALQANESIVLRNPYSVRPYQHVLDALFSYLLIARKQSENPAYAGQYNIGPDITDCLDTGTLVKNFSKYWNGALKWTESESTGPHEAALLKLDSSKIRNTLGWRPVWDIQKALEKTTQWYKGFFEDKCLTEITDQQIISYRDGISE